MGGGSLMSEELDILKNKAKLYKKLQKARLKLQNKDFKKSGYNPFQKFNYFELSDFLPHINKIFDEIGLADHINIYREKSQAELIIYDTETGHSETFYSPIQEQLGKQQDIGAMITYARRYAYNIALNISENDVLDAQDIKAKSTTKIDRVKILQMLNDNAEISQIKGWLNNNNIKANSFDELTDNQLMQVFNLFNQR